MAPKTKPKKSQTACEVLMHTQNAVNNVLKEALNERVKYNYNITTQNKFGKLKDFNTTNLTLKAQYVNRMKKEELIKMAGTAQATLANLETR